MVAMREVPTRVNVFVFYMASPNLSTGKKVK
jgi:hypothetical protein